MPVQGFAAERLNRGSVSRLGALAGLALGIGLMASGLTGCQSARELRDSGRVMAPIGAGPRVTFQNASTKRLEVRYWVGKRDPAGTSGGVDVMTPVVFLSEPGRQNMHDVGRRGWPTANLDAIVRVQINLLDEHDRQVEGVDPWWFEFETPAPYTIRAVNASQTRQNLDFETWGEGNLFIVAPDEWIPGHHGQYPVYDTP
jgi:hypothetical protein